MPTLSQSKQYRVNYAMIQIWVKWDVQLGQMLLTSVNSKEPNASFSSKTYKHMWILQSQMPLLQVEWEPNAIISFNTYNLSQLHLFQLKHAQSEQTPTISNETCIPSQVRLFWG